MSSLENTVDVLRSFSATQAELTVTEVSQMLNLPKSNVSRLLRSMRDVGLLADARDGRGYCLGAMLLGLGQVAQAGHSLGVRADAAVQSLTRQSGHSGFVSARAGHEMVGLTHHVGSNPIQVGLSLGKKLPIDACATGRAWLAMLSDEQVRELLGDKVSSATPQSPASMGELLARLQEVRSLGYAESHHEAGKGVGAIAVAVREGRTGEVLSLCVTFPEGTVESAERNALIDLLRQAQQEVMRPLT